MLQQTSKDAVAGLERRSAHVIHYNLSYLVQGAAYGTDGAIVLLHDLLGGAFSWESVLPQLAGLKRAVYAIDMLGYGQSDHPWPADTSVWGHADALALLLEQLNLTNIVLVGHGLGGGVAQILATRLSVKRVAALILVDTICYEHAFAPDWPLPDMQKSQDPELPNSVDHADVQKELRATLSNATVDSKGFAKVIDKYAEPWNSHVGKEVLYQHVRLLVPYYVNSVSSDLKVLGKPVLIIWGEQDQQNPLKYAARLHREIVDSRLVIIPNAGHLVLFDAPDLVASALNDFISKL
ncbi:MAG TPA: alpha/beta hydrolase [Ktedonobacteraceae bacterium]|nr:alpha/beta hydrolase [Ktedonobacteraceae bacterium]